MTKQMKVDGMTVTGEYLWVKASELTSQANALDLVCRLVETIEYDRVKGNDYEMMRAVRDGSLGCIFDNLTRIKGDIQAVSDSLCIDE